MRQTNVVDNAHFMRFINTKVFPKAGTFGLQDDYNFWLSQFSQDGNNNLDSK